MSSINHLIVMLTTFKSWSRNRDIANSTRYTSDKAVYAALTEINESDFILVLDALYAHLNAKYAVSTRNAYLRKTVKPFIAWLKNNSMLDHAYELPIPRVFGGKQSVKRAPIRTISESELNQVQSLLDDVDIVASEILLSTGLRPSELLAIDPRDLTEDTITITKSRVKGFTRHQTKTKRDRTIKVSAKTANLLRQFAGKFNDDFVVRFNRVCRDIGLPARVGSYALRRTAITNSVQKGHSFTKLGMYFNNSPIILERHYINTSLLVHSI